jgi:tetratricopeptide (TPR) repeat protein
MVSSTFADLEEHRERAIRAILSHEFRPRVMEYSGANVTGDVLKTSLEMVNDAAAYVLLIGHRYGQTPECPENPDGLSITELEFEEAQRLGLPILLFLMGDKHPIVLADVELDPKKREKLDAFRARAKRMSDDNSLPRVYDVFDSLDQFSTQIANAIAKLARYFDEKEKKEPPPPPPPERAISNIPIGLPAFFLGREAAMEAIEKGLNQSAGRVAITALYGLRGVGKTVLAAYYADQHAKDYRATWWLRAQTEATLRADLVGLGVRLQWVAADAKEEAAVEAVLQRLAQAGERILLIYDNAESVDLLRPFLPRGGAAKVIVTSNAPNWRAVAAAVEIRVWPKEIGADFLIARTECTKERAAAEALSVALGGLPLAHEQAAAYCEALDVGFADYLKRFEAEPVAHLGDAEFTPQEHNDRQTVAKSFALAIEEAGKRHELAEPLIRHAALLAPEPIPLFFLEELLARTLLPLAGEGSERSEPDEGPLRPSDAGKEAAYDAGPSPDPTASGHPLPLRGRGDAPNVALEKAIAALRRFALVDLEEVADERDAAQKTKCLRLHRLVRFVAAARVEGEACTAARAKLIRAMRAVYPSGVYDDPNTWPRARRLDGLALALVEDGLPPAGAEEAAISLLNRLGQYRVAALGAYRAALPLMQKALALAERHYPPEHDEIATQLSNLGVMLGNLGGAENLTAARAHLTRALAIDEKALGPEHPSVAIHLNNLATVLEGLGGEENLRQARAHLTRALAIDEKALGPEHPSVAHRLSNLATVLEGLGGEENLRQARAHLTRALAIDEKALGPERPSVAIHLSNLATVLKALGGAQNLAAARAHLTRALAIQEKALGPEHPDVANRLNNLAGVLADLGGEENLRQARAHLSRALEIHEKALGPEHPSVANRLSNLAAVLKALGGAENLETARAHLTRALEIHEKALGQEHPSVVRDLSNLATVLANLGGAENLAAARAHLTRALEID